MQINWTNRIELTEDGVSTIKEVSGVYRLIYYNPNKQDYFVYYVGQAVNLKKRLTDHLLGNEQNTCCDKHLRNYKCYFRAAAVAQQSDRDAIEVALYNKFSPSCTEKVPDVEPADVNFV